MTLLSACTWGTFDAYEQLIAPAPKPTKLPTNPKKHFEIVLEKCHQHVPYHYTPLVPLANIPWTALPPGLDPTYGQLSHHRASNKRLQIQNIYSMLAPHLQDGQVIVEFCASSGYIVLVLAYYFPRCTFVILDMKPHSIAIGTFCLHR